MGKGASAYSNRVLKTWFKNVVCINHIYVDHNRDVTIITKTTWQWQLKNLVENLVYETKLFPWKDIFVSYVDHKIILIQPFFQILSSIHPSTSVNQCRHLSFHQCQSSIHLKGFTSISPYILLLEPITIDQTLYLDTSPNWGFKYGFITNDYYQSQSQSLSNTTRERIFLVRIPKIIYHK